MGARWYFYNETLEEYYDLGSDSLTNIGSALKEVFQAYKWSFYDTIHIVNDADISIDESKILR